MASRLYAGSFWSHPYKDGAPKELLQNQEASLLRDIRDAINKRIENRISTARRFAVSNILLQISNVFSNRLSFLKGNQVPYLKF